MRQHFRNWRARFAPAVLIAAISCSLVHGQEVRTNYLPGTDFSKYRTYKWLSIGEGEDSNQIVDNEIKESIDSQLRAKGFTRVDSGDADLLVGYQVAVDREKQWTAFGTGGGPLGWGGMGMGSASSSTINIGSLVVDFYYPATKPLVWTGSATKAVAPGNSEQKNLEHLDQAMRKLLKNFRLNVHRVLVQESVFTAAVKLWEQGVRT